MVDAEGLLRFLDQEGITRANLVPSLLGLLLRSRLRWPRTLRLCIASGEVLRPDLVSEFYARAPFGSVLLNLYGSTECAGDVAWFDTRQLEPGATSVPLGLPLGQTILRVVDDDGRDLQEGEEGEIVVAGPAVALGYWKRPQDSERAFVGHPTVLHTGDRGVWSRGLLEFRGRLDRSLKVRGWRVDLHEVEAVLEASPGVREAVALPSASGLQAWVSADEGLDAETLWNALRQHLSPPQRPAVVRRLPELPRLPSGKIDRERLDDATGEPLQSDRQDPAPAPEQAKWRPLAELWEQVLQVPRVGPNDNFFELGGHSLSAVELSARIEETFEKVLPPGMLVQLPTVALLWAALQEPSPRVLVEMRQGTSDPLLCLIPGAWGGTIGFRKLVEKLDPKRAVVGLEFDGTDPADRSSLPAVAARFTSELVRFKPGGPYVICGFSAGGLIAYEMARLLGPALQHLVLLDTAGPGLVRGTTAHWPNRLRELWAHLQLLGRSRPGQVWDRLLKTPARRRYTPSEQLDLALAYLSEVQPETGFEGPVTLIRMSYQPDWVTDRLLGWGQLLPQLQERTVTGLHGPLVIEEPIVDDVASELERILGKPG
jgi:enterobactin synthetase component F